MQTWSTRFLEFCMFGLLHSSPTSLTILPLLTHANQAHFLTAPYGTSFSCCCLLNPQLNPQFFNCLTTPYPEVSAYLSLPLKALPSLPSQSYNTAYQISLLSNAAPKILMEVLSQGQNYRFFTFLLNTFLFTLFSKMNKYLL